ncbi:MAG: spermidine/putrescine ABC transporter substrate-binding protein [Nocardioidaceae bacterium]
MALAAGLTGCGTSGAKLAPGSCKSEDFSATQPTLQFSNWPQYIDPIKKKNSSLSRFEDESGISVTYIPDVNDNETFFAKVANQLAGCEPTGRDIFTLTDWMAAKMIELGWIQKLDKSRMPNVDANILPSLKSPGWDPKREYSAPWQSGMTGICYNKELTDPVGSFNELLTRPDLKGKVDLLSEMRDTMLFMLLLEQADPEDFTLTQFEAAIERLQKAVSDGQVRRFTGNDYTEDLRGGNVVACEAWSGDIPQLGDPKFVWVPAEEGVALWSDNMMVPNRATHRSNAEELFNFYYDPKNAAQLSAWNYYFCPVVGAEEYIGQYDEEAVGNPLIFPTQKYLENGYGFMALGDKEREYTSLFSKVMTG